MSRFPYAKIELDSIVRYIQKAEVKFEENWVNYERQLEKSLTKTKEFREWVQKKDDTTGAVLWFNIQTLVEQKEHPGASMFAVNKKLLKVKAEEELRESVNTIYERRAKIISSLVETKNDAQADMRGKRQAVLLK